MEFDSASDQWFVDYFHSPGSLRRGDYLTCIGNWRSVFPEYQLQIIWFDDILSRPRSVLESLAAHIGINAGFYSARPLTELQAPIHRGRKFAVRSRLRQELHRIYLPKIDELVTCH
jgi:hypothetical protein